MTIEIHEVNEKDMPNVEVPTGRTQIEVSIEKCVDEVVDEYYNYTWDSEYDYLKVIIPNKNTFVVRGQYHKMSRDVVLSNIQKIFTRFCGKDSKVDYWECDSEECKVDKIFFAKCVVC